jgi:hypothetical protein
MKKLALTLALAAAAASLVACGGGDDDSTSAVAATNLTAPIKADTVAAVTGQSFAFNSGVPDFGTTSATTLKFDTASTFSVSSAEGTASGDLSFGSCIFTVRNSTYAAGSPLATGAVVEVSPCSLNVQTASVSVSASATAVPVTFSLGTAVSVTQDFSVDILDDGSVVVNGSDVGTVQTTDATGATGASGG